MRDQVKAGPLLRLLMQTCNHYKKNYCFPSQLTLMKWLDGYYDIEISIATLNRWLRATEDLGFIKRTRRITRDPRHGMMFRSTMYFITIRGLFHLKRLGYDVVDALKRLFGFLNGKRKNNNKTAESGHSPGYSRPSFSPSDRSKILPAAG